MYDITRPMNSFNVPHRRPFPNIEALDYYSDTITQVTKSIATHTILYTPHLVENKRCLCSICADIWACFSDQQIPTGNHTANHLSVKVTPSAVYLPLRKQHHKKHTSDLELYKNVNQSCTYCFSYMSFSSFSCLGNKCWRRHILVIRQF